MSKGLLLYLPLVVSGAHYSLPHTTRRGSIAEPNIFKSDLSIDLFDVDNYKFSIFTAVHFKL